MISAWEVHWPDEEKAFEEARNGVKVVQELDEKEQRKQRWEAPQKQRRKQGRLEWDVCHQLERKRPIMMGLLKSCFFQLKCHEIQFD